MQELDQYFESLYTDTVRLQKKQKSKEELRVQLFELLGRFPEYQEKAQITKIEEKEFDDYVRGKVLFRFSENLSIPLYVLTPKEQKERYPTVIAIHGHGYGHKETVGLRPDGKEDDHYLENYHKRFGVSLVKKGMKVFAPEVIGFGDRMLTRDKESNKYSSCMTMATALLMVGKTLAGLRVAETIAILDTLNQYDDVDHEHLGIMGISGGGLIATYTAALDQRIKATVISGFANTFKGSILSIDHCIDNYIPGILKVAELPELISLIAPRDLFIESGESDPIFPVEHVKSTANDLLALYQDYGKKDNFAYEIFDGEHEISGRKSFDFLLQALKR